MLFSGGSKKSSSQQKSNSSEDSRYKHDMQQAEIMRGGSGDRNRIASQPYQEQEHKETEDVTLGLRGLEEAERKLLSGDGVGALKLYELSIEILVRFLQQSSPSKKQNQKQSSVIDRDVVASRVQSALTDAEKLKASIMSKERNVKSSASSTATKASLGKTTSLSTTTTPTATKATIRPSPDQKPERANSLSNLLSSLLSPSRSPEKQKHCHNESQSSTSSTTRKSRPTSSSSSQTAAVRRAQPPHHYARSEPTRRRQPQQQQQQQFYSQQHDSNDPLVQTIKKDIYVDPSHIEQTTWADIAGLKDAKQSLQESAILPLLRPDLFNTGGLRKPQNILLYGPPGTGKTMLVKAIANESSCLLFVCTSAVLTSKWHGDSEKLVRTLFTIATDAAPSIIFIDEMDSLLSKRTSGDAAGGGEHEASRRFKTEFMTQMDGIKTKKGSSTTEGNSGSGNGNLVLVIGCTNTPWDVDDAVLRRFPKRIYVPLPDKETRQVLISNLLKKADKHTIKSRNQINDLVTLTEGYSCSDIANIASDASYGPLREISYSCSNNDDSTATIKDINAEQIRPINMNDFKVSISKTLKSVSPSLLRKYKEWEQQQSCRVGV